MGGSHYESGRHATVFVAQADLSQARAAYLNEPIIANSFNEPFRLDHGQSGNGEGATRASLLRIRARKIVDNTAKVLIFEL